MTRAGQSRIALGVPLAGPLGARFGIRLGARLGGVMLAGLLLATGGCRVGSFGPKLDDFAPAHSGRGVITHILLPDASPTGGELLAVRDSGLLVLTAEPAVVLFHWSAVRHATFDDLAATVSHRRPPAADVLERLRLVSRHPQGIDGAQLRALLDAYGLDAMREEGT